MPENKSSGQQTLRRFLKERSTTPHSSVKKPYALMNFYSCIGDHESTLGHLLNLVREFKDKRMEAHTRWEERKSNSCSDVAADVKDEMELEDIIESVSASEGVFAGTLFVVLNNLLAAMEQRIKRAGGKPVSKVPG